jgi:hypothetical protein
MMRVVDSRIYLGTVLLALMATACRDTAAPTVPGLDGSFALWRVNGKVLPDTEAMTFSGAPWNVECAILGTSGNLALDRAAGRFTITMKARNACAGQEYLFLTEAGTYTQIGDSLSLMELYLDSAQVLTGKVDSQTVVINSGDREYTFTR